LPFLPFAVKADLTLEAVFSILISLDMISLR
jgi:hypothetical protein